MRVLALTNMYPTPRTPASGTFVATQIQSLEALGIEVEVILSTREYEGRGVYGKLGRDLVEATRRFRPDVVHAMYSGVIAGIMATSLGPIRAVQRRPALVISVCGSDILGTPTAPRRQQISGRVGVAATILAATLADRIIVKSKNLEDALPRFVSRDKVDVIPNGVDFARFRPMDRADCRRRLGFADKELHVLFPSNMDPVRKRLSLAREAVARFEARGHTAQLHEMSGVPFDQVPIWLNACDAVILTSTQEGSPNVIKEALACDIPVVSVDVGDVKERIEGLEGTYLCADSAEILADALERVARGPRRVEGRRHIAELALDAVARRVRQSYEKAIGTQKG